MSVNFLTVRGCITQEKYIKGHTLSELESILGFLASRLAQGAMVIMLLYTRLRKRPHHLAL